MYPQQDAHAGAEHQYHQFSASTPYGYSPFSATLSAVTEHQYQSSPHHLSPRLAVQQSPQHKRHGSLGSQAIIRHASRSMSPSFSSATPARSLPFTPTDRALPSKDVTQDTITDAYVEFILYCNPNFPLDVDTQTLRTTFHSPPKSDNKEFEPFRLFELLRKFDAKEIKTWGQLALDLGVEAPDLSKGQSVQKVQQYTVRLKRWMRAMHVDAFFEYLLGKDHPYVSDIPHPSDPHPANGRDGVVTEEDLAIRALNPSFRPKRGRRRNSDVEQDDTEASSATKQPRLMAETPHTLAPSPHPLALASFSAHPDSAQPDPWAVASAVTPQTFAPWPGRNNVSSQSVVSAGGPSQFRWQLRESSHDISTPHPMSAHPSSAVHQMDMSYENEPKSAVTPSSRRRKKHGPAVSSAWPSTNGPNAKPRGRPPASRNTQDGPFTTFPADPSSDRVTPQPLPIPVAPMEMATVNEPAAPLSMPTTAMKVADGTTKPGRLSLQVPPHKGGPVRLATPPRVLVNGETNDSDDHTSQVSTIDSRPYNPAPPPADRGKAVLTVESEVPAFAYESLKRSLVTDLLRAELVGRDHRLSGDESKRLADSILDRFNIPKASTTDAQDDIARLTAASWLGLGEHLNVPLGPAIGQTKRITVTRFKLDREGYEEIVGPSDDGSGKIREVFDLFWTVGMGGCNGKFELKGLEFAASPTVTQESDIHDAIIETWLSTAKQLGLGQRETGRLLKNAGLSSDDRAPGDATGMVGEDRIDWKSRYRALEFGSKMAKGEFDRYRERTLERILDALTRDS